MTADPKIPEYVDEKLSSGEAEHAPSKTEASQEEADAEVLSAPPQASFKWDWAVVANLAALYICYFAATWNLLLPSFSITYIIERFPLDASKAAWIAAGMTITNSGLQMFVGDLSDMLGRKYFVMFGMVFGVIATLVTSRSTGIEMLIGGQVINGAALSMGFLCLPLISEVVPKDRRPVMVGLGTVIAGIATTFGPIIQGAFVKNGIGGENEGWRVGLYMGCGFYFLAFALIFTFYHPSKRPNPDRLAITNKILRIDWVSVFIVTTGLVLFLLGLQYGGNPYPWTDAIVLAPLIVGICLIIAFILYNWLWKKDGLLPHSLFAHRNLPISWSIAFVGGIVMYGGQAYLPQEVSNFMTTDAILTGVYNLPFNSASSIAAISVGLILTRTKEAKPLMITGATLLLVGSGLMAVMQPHINFAAWFFPTFIIGLSVGVLTCITVVTVSLCTPNQYIAHAMVLTTAMWNIGGSLGVVIMGAIFNSRKDKNLYPVVADAVLGAGLTTEQVSAFITAVKGSATAAQLSSLPGVTEHILEVYATAETQGLADCYRFIWYSILPFVAVITVISCFLKSTKAQMTRQVAAGVDRGGH